MYTHGNETIIQPPVRKDHSGWSKVLHIAIGLLVGAAAMWFLVLPARIQLAKAEANDDIKKYSEQIAEKDEEINNLRSQVEASDSNIQQAQNEAANSVSSLENYRQVVALANSYLAEGSDVLEVFNSLGTIDQSVLPEDGLALYNAIYNQVSAEALTTLYEQGTKAWNRYNNEEAVQYLQQVVNMEVGYDDGNAVYYLGTSYERLGNIENALICANQVLEVVPAGTIRYNWAQNLINNNQAGDQE